MGALYGVKKETKSSRFCKCWELSPGGWGFMKEPWGLKFEGFTRGIGKA